jgi:hypothetical protein
MLEFIHKSDPSRTQRPDKGRGMGRIRSLFFSDFAPVRRRPIPDLPGQLFHLSKENSFDRQHKAFILGSYIFSSKKSGYEEHF